MNPLNQTSSADSTVGTSGIVFLLGLHESSITSSPLDIVLPPYSSGTPSRDTMLASQDVLSKDWTSPKEDAAWERL